MYKSIIKESYNPKLFLKFEPPIVNDSFGVSQMDEILKTIDTLYPDTKWWYGSKASEYNPFLYPIDDDEEDSGYPEEICNLIVGYRDDRPNVITYGMYCDDYGYGYGNSVDGYKWLRDNNIDYNETENMFNQLNETYGADKEKVTYNFEPPIEDETTLRNFLDFLVAQRPDLKWINNVKVTDYNIYEEVFGQGEPGVIGALTIGYFKDNMLSWSSESIQLYDENYENVVDGWELMELWNDDFDTGDAFNQLNEASKIYQPKLNLRFEDPIYDADELDKVLKVLTLVYPDLQWRGGDLVSKHNVIRGSTEDFLYEPIYYLTIGFFSTSPHKLTYTSAPDDDRSFADDEHNNFNWVDGWQWVKDNDVDYDQTTDMFNQLNESLEDSDNPLHKFDIFLDNTNTISDIEYVINLYKDFGIPSNKKNEWSKRHFNYCYEWFLDPKKDGKGLILGTGTNGTGYFIYWSAGSGNWRITRKAIGKELITFKEFLELTSFDDDNIFD